MSLSAPQARENQLSHSFWKAHTKPTTRNAANERKPKAIEDVARQSAKLSRAPSSRKQGKNAIVLVHAQGGKGKEISNPTPHTIHSRNNQTTRDLGRFGSLIVVVLFDILSSPCHYDYDCHSYCWSIFSHPSR